ncbi:MAG: PAS domain S-box protein [Gammaproteobacteria bacterium]|nr:PAS domain S-box protein [Gammaproteobacteria bacterium]
MPFTKPANRSAPAAEDRLSALLDAAVDAIVLINPIGEVTRFNRAAERVFGYDAAEVLGRNVSMLMPEPYRAEHDRYMARYLQTGERRIIGIGREAMAQRKDGSLFPVELSVGEFQRGGERGFVGILRDITERKQHEEQLRQTSEQLRRMLENLDQSMRETKELRDRLTHVARLGTLGEMVSGIAHEVNQPLTAIANYANACRRLLGGGARPEDLAAPLEKISVQAERAGQVIRGLRNLLRRHEGVREPLDCNQLVREVARLTEFDLRQSGFRLEQSLATSLPPVMGDRVQIQQVVLNLLRNAYDAMAQGARDDVVRVETASARDAVEIEVSDSGPGIPAEVAERLFEPFFTTKADGIGVGLSICKSIVSAHNGELSYTPNERGGATFRVRLPAVEA